MERQCVVDRVRRHEGFVCVCVSKARVRRPGRRVCLPDFSIRVCVVAIRCHFLFFFFLKLNDVVLEL